MGARVPNQTAIESKVSRRGRLLVDGSPSFPFTNASLAANVVWVLNLVNNTPHGTVIGKYLPLDHVEVLNEALTELRITLNDVTEYLVKAGSSRVINRPFWQLKITNIGAVTAAAGEIDVAVELMPQDADSLARRRVAEGVS